MDLIHKLHRQAAQVPGGAPAVDPYLVAATALGDSLIVISSEQASVITVSFTNPNPAIAAQVVNTLVADYLAERQGLYADIRSDTIQQQITAAQQTLNTLAQKAGNFAQQNAIYDFGAQQALLLNQIDSLQKDLDQAENAHAQALSRIATLHGQTRATPVDVMQSTTIDYDSQISVLQASMNNLLAQEAELLTQFQPDSEPVQTVEQQIAMLKTTISQTRAENMPSIEQMGRNPTFDSVNGNLLQAQVDLSATAAQESTDRGQIRSAIAQLNQLSANQAMADELNRQKNVAEQNYQGLVQQYAAVTEAEQLAQRKAENVRMIEPALPPLQPAGLPKLIMEAGVFLSLCLGGLAAVLCELRRPGFISAGKLQRATGLPLLTTVPETAALAQSAG